MNARGGAPVHVPEREVLRGPRWPAVPPALLGLLFLSALFEQEPARHWALLGVLQLCLAAYQYARCDTVLDRTGIRPSGSLRRTRWSDVTSVRPGTSRWCARTVDLQVRGRRRPLRLEEHRGGLDARLVHEHWQLSRSQAGAPPARPA